jgi:diacylglycerol kinase (ATP)
MFSQVAEVFQRLVDATACSLAGLKSAARHGRAFRQELGTLLLVIPAGLWLGNGGVERTLLIGSWLFVIVIEIVNSAIETVVDRVGAERNELSGRAKDLGSAAVFAAIGLAGVVWLLVLTGHQT